LLPDPTDTWSHDIDRYPDMPYESPSWLDPVLFTTGPLLTVYQQEGRIGDSRLRAQWRLYHNKPYVDYRLDVHWMAQHHILKLFFALSGTARHRIDGIPGGMLQRENAGQEQPVHDWCYIEENSLRLGVVCPDVFALDATPDRLRFTLLRSPVMAHHVPDPGTAGHRVFADQGTHHFRFRFYGGTDITPAHLALDSLMLQRPLLMADLTRGMPRMIG
jgi:alpha-mannosidase